MQKQLLEKARAFRDANTHRVETFEQLKKGLDEKGGFYVGPWCQSRESEEKLKEETKATIRCLPMDAEFNLIPEEGACVITGQKGNNVRAIFARAY